MTAFSRAELERLAAGKGDSLSTSRQQNSLSTSYNAPPAPRNLPREIYDACYSADHALSRVEICRALGLVKAPWIIAHIEKLVGEGYLVRLDGLCAERDRADVLLLGVFDRRQ